MKIATLLEKVTPPPPLSFPPPLQKGECTLWMYSFFFFSWAPTTWIFNEERNCHNSTTILLQIWTAPVTQGLFMCIAWKFYLYGHGRGYQKTAKIDLNKLKVHIVTLKYVFVIFFSFCVYGMLIYDAAIVSQCSLDFSFKILRFCNFFPLIETNSIM